MDAIGGDTAVRELWTLEGLAGGKTWVQRGFRWWDLITHGSTCGNKVQQLARRPRPLPDQYLLQAPVNPRSEES